MLGEYDVLFDNGEVYIEFFGCMYYLFDYKGVYFIVIDNVFDLLVCVGEV